MLNLKTVSLVHQEALSLCRISHFLCVLRHQWVEVGVVFLSNHSCTKKTPPPLVLHRSVDRKKDISECFSQLVFLVSVTFLGTQHSAQSLSLLSTRPSMRRDLNQNVCLGQVKGRVSYLRQRRKALVIKVLKLHKAHISRLHRSELGKSLLKKFIFSDSLSLNL